jgi:hypothetical protein
MSVKMTFMKMITSVTMTNTKKKKMRTSIMMHWLFFTMKNMKAMMNLRIRTILKTTSMKSMKLGQSHMIEMNMRPYPIEVRKHWL